MNLKHLRYFTGGGVNGRKVELISWDDGYSPLKTVEQTRRMVEQDGVLSIFGSLGTPTNLASLKGIVWPILISLSAFSAVAVGASSYGVIGRVEMAYVNMINGRVTACRTATQFQFALSACS